MRSAVHLQKMKKVLDKPWRRWYIIKAVTEKQKCHGETEKTLTKKEKYFLDKGEKLC